MKRFLIIFFILVFTSAAVATEQKLIAIHENFEIESATQKPLNSFDDLLRILPSVDETSRGVATPWVVISDGKQGKLDISPTFWDKIFFADNRTIICRDSSGRMFATPNVGARNQRALLLSAVNFKEVNDPSSGYVADYARNQAMSDDNFIKRMPVAVGSAIAIPLIRVIGGSWFWIIAGEVLLVGNNATDIYKKGTFSSVFENALVPFLLGVGRLLSKKRAGSKKGQEGNHSGKT